MSRNKKIAIGLAIAAALGALAYASVRFQRTDAVTVSADVIIHRDLEEIVSASGKIRAKKQVNISANTMGSVTRLAVQEGDRVKAGQFLLQIDPKSLQSAVRRNEAGLQAARSGVEQMRVAVQLAKDNLSLAQENLKRQRDLWKEQLTTKESLDRAETEVKLRESELRARETDVRTQQQRLEQNVAELDSAKHDLSKVTISAPIDGLITRRNIEEGETVVIGTMNNAGTVLMTIADMSVIESEVEVDETDIVGVKVGQTAKITIDAYPDKAFSGRVTEIGNSAIQTVGPQTGTRQATNFKVVVTLDDAIAGVRPDFTCTADITTATRQKALSVPIQALTVRELTVDAKGDIVKMPANDKRRRRSVEPSVAASDELPSGQTRKEKEGVFVIRGGKAEFVPVSTGIAGEKYFEVLSGLQEGDRVITGPFNSVRDLTDGDDVKIAEPTRRR